MKDSGHNRATQIENDEYRAEVLQGGTTQALWYYIIHRRDSNEIAELAKFETYAETMREARKALGRLKRESTVS